MSKPTTSADTMPAVQDTKAILRKLFTDYLDTTSAILQSHTFTEDAELELKEADKNLLNEIDNLEVVTDDFDSLIEQLEKFKTNGEFDSVRQEIIADMLDEQTAIYAAEQVTGYAVIKLCNIFDGDKLTDFVNREIYPYNIGGKSEFKLF